MVIEQKMNHVPVRVGVKGVYLQLLVDWCM